MTRVLLALAVAAAPSAVNAQTPPVAGAGANTASAPSASPGPKPFTPPPNWVIVPAQPSATGTVPSQAPAALGVPTPPPPPPAVLPPRPTLAPTSITQHSEAQVRAKLGEPQIARREAGGALWTYATEACSLMVFFQAQGREGLRVTGAQAGARQRGQRAPDLESCITATAATPRRG